MGRPVPVFPLPTIEKEHAVERLEPNGGGWGGKNRPAQSFPTPLLGRNMQLAKCFLNLNFSLGQDNHECSDTVQE